MRRHHSEISLSEVHKSVDTNHPGRSKWKRVLSFLGPAYLVSVGYMDPGNWATDLAGGSQFGYSLLWVLVMSNIMALLLQSLSARLGIVRNKDLAQVNRETYPRSINLILYILAEIAIAATDLAEILGMAIGIQLLTGLPLIYGVLLTVLDTFLLMLLQRLGIRKLEAFIVGLIFIIAVSFFIQIFVANPNAGEVVSGLVPHLENSTALYIAIGIIGATVMPHNLYLHSALVQTRKFNTDDKGIRKALKMNFIDSAVALNMALLVNAAILILAATVFYKTGRTDVAEIKQAYELLPQHLGSTFAAHLFAIALIAAGQSSTITGTLAGQIVMEGYLRLRINPIVRRLITRLIAIVPAVLVILFYGEEDVDNLLIFSQVILSLQLGFAIIPLIHFVSDKKTMGKFAINIYVKISAWLIAIVLVYLNLRMIIEESDIFIESSSSLIWKIFVVIAGILFILFLGYTTYYPLSKTRKKAMISHLHNEPALLNIKPLPEYKKIAIALDFSDMDQPLFNQALTQGSKKTKFVLIHIVESVSANVYNEESTDNETQTDRTFLQHYSDQLKELGYNAEAKLGFGKTAREIARIVNETQSELLVIGAHGHRGFSDFIYGETINNVRHRIKVPVLVVNKPRV